MFIRDKNDNYISPVTFTIGNENNYFMAVGSFWNRSLYKICINHNIDYKMQYFDPNTQEEIASYYENDLKKLGFDKYFLNDLKLINEHYIAKYCFPNPEEYLFFFVFLHNMEYLSYDHVLYIYDTKQKYFEKFKNLRCVRFSERPTNSEYLNMQTIIVTEEFKNEVCLKQFFFDYNKSKDMYIDSFHLLYDFEIKQNKLNWYIVSIVFVFISILLGYLYKL